MTDPRIEPMAEALYGFNYGDDEWLDFPAPLKDEYREMATAAIAAIDKAATITTVEEFDALTEGTLIMCANPNPKWPEVFLHTGARDPWLMLDPADRNDGETTLHSGVVLNWHGKGEARVIHWGTE